jgi:hypothetical protein
VCDSAAFVSKAVGTCVLSSEANGGQAAAGEKASGYISVWPNTM